MPTVSELLASARAHHQAGRLADAERHYQQVLEIDPIHVDTLILLAAACKDQGKLDAAMTHIARAMQLQPARAEPHNLLAILLANQGRLDEAITSFAQASRLRPDSAEFAKNFRTARATQATARGIALEAEGKPDEAVVAFREALAAEPDHAPAHGNLGNLLKGQGHLDQAAVHYRRVLQLQPSSADACYSLGLVAKEQGNPDEAARWCRKALELRADHADAHYTLASVLLALNQHEEAEQSFRRALELRPDFSAAHLGLAFALLARGRFVEGWPLYESRLKTMDMSDAAFDAPRWTGSSLDGKTILLRCEQGFGDNLQFIRYAELLKRRGATVLVWCRPPVARILRTNAGVDCVLRVGDPLPPFDFQSPLASVPGIIGTTLETIPSEVPYLAPDAELVDYWKSELARDQPGNAPALKIGIAWHCDPTHPDRTRWIPLARFAGIARNPGACVYSLQMGAGREQLASADLPVIDLGDRLGDFYNTAAIVRNLDLVITSDSAPAHLAGALGVSVWIALPFAGEWRWLVERADSPWYHTMRLFRQTRPGDWPGVFERIQTELSRLVESASNRR